jgi:cob(I)alamin adenosyltransferase
MDSFNKRGDGGTTSLLFGHRVPKHSARPEAYGVIDEANSALGLARALSSDEHLREVILSIQEKLFLVGAELATLPEEVPKLKERISGSHTEEIEKLIEKYEKLVQMPKAFIPPGGSPAAGAIDLARSVLRRAERRISKLCDDGEIVNPDLQSYCNRLADLLFTLARYEEANTNRIQ